MGAAGVAHEVQNPEHFLYGVEGLRLLKWRGPEHWRAQAQRFAERSNVVKLRGMGRGKVMMLKRRD
jgi:hypothetical protein